MIRRLRNCFLLPVVLAISTSFCLAQTRPVTRIQEDDPSIAYSGNWYTNRSPLNAGGSAALTNATGARAVVTFTGSAITWIGVGDRWNGLATVTLDGLTRKVDSWAETTRYQTVLFTVSGLSIGPHKLSIEINHERGPNGEGSWVWLDAFDVMQTTIIQPQTPVFSINLTAFCAGAAWSLGVSNARPSASVRLIGTTNGQPWVVAEWATTDVNGRFTLGGTFAEGTLGSHTLKVEIDGKTSNTISFAISKCSP